MKDATYLQIEKSKILIVDDKPENLFILEDVLGELNVEFIRATNGEEALKTTLKHDFALNVLII